MSAIEHGSVTAFHLAHLAGRGMVEVHNVVVRIHAASWQGLRVLSLTSATSDLGFQRLNRTMVCRLNTAVTGEGDKALRVVTDRVLWRRAA